MPTCRSYSRSHLLAIRMTGKLSLSFTRRICWWNVLISSKEFREVMEYTSKNPSPVRMYCSLMALQIKRPAFSIRGSRHERGNPMWGRRGDGWLQILCLPVLFLASGVKDIEKGDFIINDTLFSVRIFFQAKCHLRSSDTL